ncbi:thioredoxin domain-containing protein [Frigidibacter sp. MR17.24]|uniref:thioredoxin domain-containing protein n=1 Tax=Frigidibacter sp. MR17.24 TaxID=3127345 RepID=UPI003013071D
MPESLKLTCLACGQANRVPAERLGAGPKCGTCGAGLVTGKVAAIDAAIHAKAKGDDLPLVVDYWAAWCGPCRAMAPEFARASETLKGRVRFAKLDTEAAPKVSQQLGIRGIPLLILWRGGRELGRAAGQRPAAQIVQFLQDKAGAGPR